MEQEVKKPFKTVMTSYYREVAKTCLGTEENRVRIVTEEKQWVGSNKDPVIVTRFEYL